METYYTLCSANKNGGSPEEAAEASSLLLRKVLGKEAFSKIRYTEKGKPFIENGPDFSVSHSGELVVVLVSDSPCGVDAEPVDYMGRRKPTEVLSADELGWLEDKVHNYMTLWTRKEAALKAFGDMELAEPKSFTALNHSNSIELNGSVKFIGTYYIAGNIVSWASDRLETPLVTCIDLETLKQ